MSDLSGVIKFMRICQFCKGDKLCIGHRNLWSTDIIKYYTGLKECIHCNKSFYEMNNFGEFKCTGGRCHSESYHWISELPIQFIHLLKGAWKSDLKLKFERLIQIDHNDTILKFAESNSDLQKYMISDDIKKRFIKKFRN